MSDLSGQPVPQDLIGKIQVNPPSGGAPASGGAPGGSPSGGQGASGQPVPQGEIGNIKVNDTASGGAQSDTSGAYPEDAEMGDLPRGAVHGTMEGLGGLLGLVPDTYAYLYNSTSHYNLLAQAGLAPKHIGSLGSEINKGINKTISPPKTMLGNLVDFGASMLAGAGAGSIAAKLLEDGTTAVQMARKYTAVERAVISDARSHGITLSPEYIGGQFTKAMQTMSGGPRVSQAASIKNIDIIDNMAKTQLAETFAGRALKLDPTNMELEGPLKAQDKIIEFGNNEYKEVGQLIGPIPQNAETKPLWDELFDKVRAAGGRHAKRIFSPFGKNVPTKLAMTKLQYLDPQEDQSADELFDEVRVLRENARARLAKPDAEENPVGKGEWEIAQALDNLVGGYAELLTKAGKLEPATFQRYLNARQDMAIAHTYDGVTSPGGHIMAKALANAIQQPQGAAFTGNLQKIGTWAAMFPKDFQPMYEKGEQGMFSAVDYLLGGSGIIFNHPMEFALAVMRPIARSTVLSTPVQDSMASMASGKGASYFNAGTSVGGAAAAQETSRNDSDSQP